MSTQIDVADGDSVAVPTEEFVGVGFWVRAGGQLIDLVPQYILWFAATFAFAIGLGFYAAMTHTSVEPLVQKLATSRWYDYVAASVGSVVYFAVMERMCGATIGKRLLGLVVIRRDGGPIDFRAALGRSLAFYIDGLFFGAVAYGAMEPPLQQRLGDRWCDTLVIRRSTLPPGSAVATQSFLLALLCGVAADAACCWLSALAKVA
ncbi:MAG TPA: RDD family protein [Steroidobacteraceae bacterium]|nr:RDD family protein [Steroidobacteraceae bacterium]